MSIITDPYTPERTGYKPFTEAADLVVVSSDSDRSHCRSELIPGSPLVVNALELARAGGLRIEKGIPFQAIQAREALDHPGHDPDDNGMYRFVVDGVGLGHMGDVGNPLSEAQLDFFQGVDVLLALAGGPPTIELDDLKTVIDQVAPRLVIPMHFRTLRYRPQNLSWISDFLAYFDPGRVEFACSEEVEISPARLPEVTRVRVLDYA